MKFFTSQTSFIAPLALGTCRHKLTRMKGQKKDITTWVRFSKERNGLVFFELNEQKNGKNGHHVYVEGSLQKLDEDFTQINIRTQLIQDMTVIFGYLFCTMLIFMVIYGLLTQAHDFTIGALCISPYLLVLFLLVYTPQWSTQKKIRTALGVYKGKYKKKNLEPVGWNDKSSYFEDEEH